MSHSLHRMPADLSQALDTLSYPGVAVISGGTDWFPAHGTDVPPGAILDISALPEFRGIRQGPDGWRIGAATTWSEIRRADLPPAFDALRQAAAEVGSVQIQNAGTLGGNLCNASPAADGVPPLLVLDASVELVSHTGVRVVALADFLIGPRRTALRAGELVSAVLIPAQATAGVSSFLKAGARKYLVISVAMLAVRVEVSGGIIVRAAIAAGSCGPVAVRLRGAEALLHGASVGALPSITAADLPEIAPIDDHRGSAAYRRAALAEMLTRAVVTLGAGR